MKDSGFFAQLNREYRKNQGISPAKRKKLSAISKLEKLEEYRENGMVVDMFVDYSDTATGDLYHIDSVGITYILKAEEIKNLFPDYTPRGNSYLLGTSFKAVIGEIREDEQVVLKPVECSLKNEEYMRFEQRGGGLASHAERLTSSLFSGLNESGKKPLIRGTVVSVEEDRVFLDIFDTGVTGIIPVKNYAEKYIRDLRDIVYPGDCVKGVVIAYRARSGEEEKHFIVSTADYLPDIWKILRQFQTGDVIVIKCVEKPTGATQHYFWGVSRVLPAMDIMSDYSTKVPETAVSVGRYYKCKIKQIDPRKGNLKVVPFAECGSYETGMDKI